MTMRRLGGFLLVLMASVFATQCSAQSGGSSASDYGKPAPEWLRESGMFNGWYMPWTDDMLERVKGFPLIVTPTVTPDIVQKLHARGVRVICYVNAYVINNARAIEREIQRRRQGGELIPPEWESVAESPFNRMMDLTQHPDWIWVGPDGYPRKKPATYEEVYNSNPVCLQACPNAPGFREAELAAVKALMAMGADGLFLDCVENSHRKLCWGPEFGLHKHVHPEWDDNQAWLSLQKEIYNLVKSYGPDKVVLLNGGSGAGSPDYLCYADAYMLESYILTHVSTRRWQSWEQIQKMAEQTAPAVKAGKVVLALSYVGYTSNSIEEDAFYAYACARLYGYCWADWFTLADARATLLYRLKLGAPRSQVRESNGILYKLFQNGVVVVNPNYEDRELQVKTGFTFLREVLTNRRYAFHDESKGITLDTQELQAIIPAESGRVFISGFSN